MSTQLSILAITILLGIQASAGIASADLFINEFSSASSTDDWIEIYNNGSEETDLSRYRIRDTTDTNKLDLDGTLSSGGFKVFSWSNKLNISGDIIKIVLKSDETNILNQVAYGDKGNDVAAPIGNQSAGRISNGSNQWIIFASSSKEASNAESSPAPTPTSSPVPTPTRTPTPTKSPTPTKTPTKATSGSIYHTSTTIAAVSPTVKINSLNSRSKTPTKPISISAVPTSILGMGVKSVNNNVAKDSDKKILVDSANKKNSSLGPIFATVGIIAIACGILVFFIKKNKHV